MHLPLLPLLFTLVCASAFAQAPACPDPEKAGFARDAAPLCPEQGTLLGEGYPVMAVTVSTDVGGVSFVKETILEVFAAQAKPLPMVFVNTRIELFPRLLRELTASPGWSAEKTARVRPLYASALDEWGEMQPYTDNWQQDYIKGFFDPRTGLPVSRVSPTYDGVGDIRERTQAELAACGIKPGPALETPTKKNGYSGGNFDAGPPGTCVLGRSDLSHEDWNRFAANTCAGLQPIGVPSEWTSSTHADELVKTIPLPGGGQCDFAIAFASPRKGLEVLARNPHEPVFDRGRHSPEDFERLIGRLAGLGTVCGIHQKTAFEKREKYRIPPFETTTLGGLATIGPRHSSYTVGGFDRCDDLTNGKLRAIVLEDPALREVNELIEKKMTAFKEQMLAQVKAKNPGCEPKVLDFPYLFAGRVVVESDGRHRLGRLAEGASHPSVFPNPTNGHLIGRTYLSPEPYNPAFKREIESQLRGLQLRTRFVDTIASHSLLGNLHCTTQVFRYCRPR